ncbi:MAG: AAA family ATPase, partial [Cellvibrionales bacterium]|nr:AAA family ATPase [Cellvibrionales bacterium]
MDKRVIFAVAGAGKTTHIIDSLSLEKRALIVTYTENNYHHLRQRIINKFGVIPDNIAVFTYFTFLYRFCYKPFLYDRVKAKGINWDMPHPNTLKLARSTKEFYKDVYGRLYHNRIAKLIEQQRVIELVNQRIYKYFDHFYVDEVQDFGGHDFNLLIALCQAQIDMTFVGDFYQHTFDTSKDGKLNSGLYKDFGKYKKVLQKAGLEVDATS